MQRTRNSHDRFNIYSKVYVTFSINRLLTRVVTPNLHQQMSHSTSKWLSKITFAAAKVNAITVLRCFVIIDARVITLARPT